MNIKIGIDPDIEKSGYAVMSKGGFVHIGNHPFFVICDDITKFRNDGHSLVVCIEAGWLHKKSNWHGGTGVVAQKIARNVGENHAAGKFFVQFCQHHGITYQEILPKGKIDAKTFRSITGWQPRTNQEQRDAAMLIF